MNWITSGLPTVVASESSGAEMEWNFMSSDACMPLAMASWPSAYHSPAVCTHLPVDSASFHSLGTHLSLMPASKLSSK